MNSLKQLTLILFTTILIFLVIDYFFGKKIEKLIKITDDEKVYRIENAYFHHGFLKNYSTNKARWGNKFYKFCSDHNGFKYDCVSNYESDFDFAFIGDSMTEAIGLEYEDTFVGMFKKFTKLRVANLGVSSYSPNLYKNKVIHLIENDIIRFKHLVVSVDFGDLYDDRSYNKNYLSKEKSVQDDDKKYHQYNLISRTIHKTKFFLKNNFIFTDYLLRQIWWLGLRNLFSNHSDHYISYNNPRSSWGYDDNYLNNEDLKFMIENMLELSLYLKKKDVKFTLMIYPHPASILYDSKSSTYKKTWEKFCISNCDYFIDSFTPFFDLKKNNNEIINKYYIKGDVHFNKDGNKFLFNQIINKLNYSN